MLFTRLLQLGSVISITQAASQVPLQTKTQSRNGTINPELFADLERAARLADIAYCVAPPALGISKPFACLSRCADFPGFELVTTWNTGTSLSDCAGYLAIDHGDDGRDGQIVIALRGTYSITNTIIDLSTIPQEYTPYPGRDDDDDAELRHPHYLQRLSDEEQDRCVNCTVHIGFNTAWQHTRQKILPDLLAVSALFPKYTTTLIGHSLGGAVAMLAALELRSRGYDPTVTTFGEPRVGNQGLIEYLDARFELQNQTGKLKYRRITHIDDPVPLLPLTEWGFAMHAGEIFISKADLSPDIGDVNQCDGDTDPACIASQDSTARPDGNLGVQRRDLLDTIRTEIHDIQNEPWGIPSRYKLWQLVFAHRDYFHRIGLCVPGGDPFGGGHDYN